jgi:uncharacterized protein YebE (UPF0316 family)
MDSPFVAWIAIPLLIFLARICDVSIGTLRIVFIGRGKKLVAPILGFFEVLIWLFAIRQIMEHLTMSFYYFVYAGGFASGTFVGMYLEEKLAVGVILVRIVSSKDATELIDCLKSEDYGVTSVGAQGSRGRVHLIYTVIKRSDLARVLDIINRFDPNLFDTVEDVRFVKEGVFPSSKVPLLRGYAGILRFWRKGK